MERIGKFEIIEEIGFGGMGIVYKARHPLIGETVAIKVFSPGPGSSPSGTDEQVDDLRRRFLREAKILWGLKHPHIIHITDLDEDAGTPFIVMDYCPSNLATQLGLNQEATRLYKTQIDEKRARGWLQQILAGLGYAHDQQVLHRDIKPSNILLDAEGHVKVSDFGIARKIGMSRMTRTGYIGTMEFSAPEQMDAKRVDHRADLWAVGMLAYMLLTGRHPLLTRFNPPSAVNEKIHGGWDAWFDRATAENPEERYKNADQMAKAMAGIFVHRPQKPPAKPHATRKAKDGRRPPLPNDKQKREKGTTTIGSASIGDGGEESPKPASTKVPIDESVEERPGPGTKAQQTKTVADGSKTKKNTQRSFIKGLVASISGLALLILMVIGGYLYIDRGPAKTAVQKVSSTITGIMEASAAKSLRSKPAIIADSIQANRLFGLNKNWRPIKYVANQFKENGNRTVSDFATGLMWQQGGSDKAMNLPDTRRYVEQLNRERWAGYSNWRLPTINELCSLLKPKKPFKLYTDPIFYDKQWSCLSADLRSSGTAWGVGFDCGYVYYYGRGSGGYVRAVRTIQ